MYDAQGALCFIMGPSRYNGERRENMRRCQKAACLKQCLGKEVSKIGLGASEDFIKSGP